MKSFFAFALIVFSITRFEATFGQFSQDRKDLPITTKEKKQIIDSLIHFITTAYIFPDIASKVEKALRLHQERGDYNRLTSSKIFSDTISEQLVRISQDKHLRVLYSFEIIRPPSGKEPPLPEFIKKFAIENNYGFNKIEILDGNIGYLNILGFFPMEEATQKAIAALDSLSHTNALIIDLRDNSGGAGPLANFILSYFFNSEPVHFLDFYFRRDNRVEQSWSSFYIPGKRIPEKPIYILTSSSTFSAGEAFAFVLQSLHRATIIGEVTGGGANVGDLLKLNDHFVLNLPIGRPLSPLTKTNWEGVGVQPDIKVPRDKALAFAQAAALAELQGKKKNSTPE
jgi:hypothetical protein